MYDLFLVPADGQFKKYSTIIHSLSKTYKVPSFPHVTLLSLVEADEKELLHEVEKCIKGFNTLEVDVLGVSFSNTVSQCVFAQIKMTMPLLNLYEELATNLHYSDTSPFFPHMSFVYGDLSTEVKSAIAQKVKVGEKLLLDKLVIYRDGSLPSDWKRVAEFELGP